ncbi:hypothetical protein [Silvimonas iriomotensis]|uniref:Uncharacterized protein n=1 Tax=Silvimonas iriomotensis TaxID=449662 RepID=A0ABQ2P7M7_9NEIS|nr:hypothetical protein [Silvimonas iriomotensis]GGP20407.1 hypothetical protein GCM10010970_15070 [Silvimonas iriomotensis]
MKPLITTLLLVASCAVLPLAQADTGALTVRFTSPLWNGASVPPGQQCARLGGSAATPGLNVFDLPAGTAFLQVEFSERGGLDNGGMGRLQYVAAKGAGSAQIPSVPAQGPLPAGLKSLGARDGSIYSAPCVKGNHYYLTVKALAADGARTLAEGRLDMGRLP